jgi:hypothetical protein
MNTYTDFDTMTENPEWLGFGYLSNRLHLSEIDRAAGDALVLAFATDEGWSDAALFEWANSKSGRHFADAIDGGDYDLGWRELVCYPERVSASFSGCLQ